MDHVCIHGHFYQPPRENPWTERVPIQPSAAPFHDWNARITEECYRPNGAARIRDAEGRILAVVNNYARISFDVGPTLLTWLDEHAPEVRDAMIAGDRAAVRRWGHGTAIAQAYSHVILPLANERDRRTQIRWALADFETRFGRRSEGLWLPECAVDTPTLENLVDEGVKYVILAPRQVSGSRPAEGAWQEGVDPNRPYRIHLPSGRSIAAFVYDGAIAQDIAFGGLLDSGDALYERLREAARRGGLAHTATDGESYGHHHRFGEMALAWAMQRLEWDEGITMVPYGRYLADHPPTWEARLVENSSWSCVHGVERWRSDCGCGTAPGGGHWRAPLRAALDALADRLDALFEQVVGEQAEPWRLRDAYIEVLHGADIGRWLADHLGSPVAGPTEESLRTALEMQRQRVLMYASCGWFFDDLAGIEPVQNLVYAWRAVELASRLSPDEDFVGPFVADLANAHSNHEEAGTGADLLRSRVVPEHLDLRDAAARSTWAPLGPAYEVAGEDFGIGESAWHVERTRIQEQRTGHARTVIRAWNPDSGWAGVATQGSSVSELVQALDNTPGGAHTHLGWAARRQDPGPSVDGVRPVLSASAAALHPRDVRSALRNLELVDEFDLNRAEEAELEALWARLLAHPDTHDPRWKGIRARAIRRFGLHPGPLQVPFTELERPLAWP